MKPKDIALAGEGLNINAIVNIAARAAEKATNLTPVFLSRKSFAANATSTGSLEMDRIMGGGIPPGRTVGIIGPEHAGKSVIATQIASEQLKKKHITCYMDGEGGNDPLFLKARGIDFDLFRGRRDKAGKLKKDELDTVLYYQPETGEQMAHYMDGVMRAMPENRSPDHPPVIFMIDSVVSLISQALAEDLDANQMAMHAKMYAQIMPVINSQLVRTGCSFVYTNQLRQKPMVQFGSPDYEPCGSTLQFFSSIRLRLGHSKPKYDDDKDHPFVDGFIPMAKPKQGGVWEEPHLDADGKPTDEMDRYIYTAVRTYKNKVYTPQKVCWIRIQFESAGSTGHGIDPVFDLFSFLLNTGFLQKDRDAKKGGMFFRLTNVDKIKEFGIPLEFTYQVFKHWVSINPGIVAKVRQKVMIDMDALSGDLGLDEVVEEVVEEVNPVVAPEIELAEAAHAN